jgi:hypothetical protein
MLGPLFFADTHAQGNSDKSDRRTDVMATAIPL